MRLIASAIIVHAGAVCTALSVQGTSDTGVAMTLGVALLAPGGFVFMAEFFRTFLRPDEQKQE
jgi:Na+-transporting NADH:ubiquinone oxidoreductase subunit NqrD